MVTVGPTKGHSLWWSKYLENLDLIFGLFLTLKAFIMENQLAGQKLWLCLLSRSTKV
jgi:hypothetical protein